MSRQLRSVKHGCAEGCKQTGLLLTIQCRVVSLLIYLKHCTMLELYCGANRMLKHHVGYPEFELSDHLKHRLNKRSGWSHSDITHWHCGCCHLGFLEPGVAIFGQEGGAGQDMHRYASIPDWI